MMATPRSRQETLRLPTAMIACLSRMAQTILQYKTLPALDQILIVLIFWKLSTCLMQKRINSSIVARIWYYPAFQWTAAMNPILSFAKSTHRLSTR